MTSSFPVALNLEGRACLVVGNGPEALRRVEALSQARADICLVTRKPDAQLKAICAEHGVQIFDRDYVDHDMAGKWLVVLCDRNAELAARMGHQAEQERVYFCAIDQPDHNSFSHMGLARSGPVCVAIGTEGKAPALARRLKQEFQRLLQEPAFVDYVEQLVRQRENATPQQRSNELNQLVDKLHLRGRFVIDE